MRMLLAGYRSSPQSGGQGVYMRWLARALTAEGARVECVSGPPYPEVEEDGAPLHRLPSLDLFAQKNALRALRLRHWRSWTDLAEWASHNTGAFGEPRAFGRRFAAFIQKRARDYDCVFDNQTFAYGMLAARRVGLGLCGVVHHPVVVDKAYEVARQKGWFARALKRRWYGFTHMQARAARGYHRLLTVSAHARDDAARAFALAPEAFRVAWNGVDVDFFRPRPEGKEERAGEIFTVASAASPIKGLDVLARAFVILAARRPEARLRLAGAPNPQGPGGAALAALAAQGRVVYEGRMERQALARAYAEASVVAAPSRYEGFGMPLAEAMACGACVVASTGGAQGEILGDAGFAVAPDAPEALADALEAALADAGARARLGALARTRAVDNFSWRAHARAVLAMAEDGVRDARDAR